MITLYSLVCGELHKQCLLSSPVCLAQLQLPCNCCTVSLALQLNWARSVCQSSMLAQVTTCVGIFTVGLHTCIDFNFLCFLQMTKKQERKPGECLLAILSTFTFSSLTH